MPGYDINHTAAESLSGTRGSWEFSFRKVLVSKAQAPEFSPQNPCEKLSMMLCVCNSSTGEGETSKDTSDMGVSQPGLLVDSA